MRGRGGRNPRQPFAITKQRAVDLSTARCVLPLLLCVF